MKLYQSPLFIGSTILLLYSIYLFVDDIQNPSGWGFLLAVPMLLIALTGIVVHFLLKKIIGKNIRIYFFIELALLLSAALILLIR
ncbi:hypothetical protein ESA94_07920 [Lacibacter luteus]|uniref:Uncharacterized protein n=1 Tax=Lacibacter luteus TaxID=2508719 RepID=A0A4Q1CJ63_9BACT|nr:hypothetical protein [Lacibacter luteus]RXK60388.1 hypothetical protein ESA94_07920 [Lacibacter luteus]